MYDKIQIKPEVLFVLVCIGFDFKNNYRVVKFK